MFRELLRWIFIAAIIATALIFAIIQFFKFRSRLSEERARRERIQREFEELQQEQEKIKEDLRDVELKCLKAEGNFITNGI